MINKTIYDLLRSRKYTIKDRKIIFIGEVTQTIYNKSLFYKNEDLHEYISIFEKILLLPEPFKNYLYRSRTLLTSRITREIYKEQDSSKISKLIQLHIDFVTATSINTEKLIKQHNKNTIKNNESLLENFLEKK